MQEASSHAGRRYSLTCERKSQNRWIKSQRDNKLVPEDTWAVSNLGKVEATQTYHEWLSQGLLAAASNIQLEGDDAAFTALTAPSRFGNDLQILSKTFLVSDSLEAAKKAGRGSEVARGAMVKMRELKRDMEYAITRNQVSSVGTATTGRHFAGMETWIGGFLANAFVGTTVTASTAIMSTTTANTCTTPALTSGKPSTAPTDGTTTATLTNTNLNLALQGAWSNGGDPSVILATANNKTAIDAFTSIATRFVDVDAATQSPIIGAANVYVSDFGRHTVVLHRYVRTVTLLCIDPNYWAIAFLRRPMARELARTGDGTKYQIITECTLVARNWQASAKVVALT
ncbi:MAG: SU10 major capsid protein [Blastocatellia bacterium]